MRIRVLAFARLADLLGWSERELSVCGDTARDVWEMLCDGAPQLAPLAESTRFARNGRVVQSSEHLHDGDEVALLPPVGGG